MRWEQAQNIFKLSDEIWVSLKQKKWDYTRAFPPKYHLHNRSWSVLANTVCKPYIDETGRMDWISFANQHLSLDSLDNKVVLRSMQMRKRDHTRSQKRKLPFPSHYPKPIKFRKVQGWKRSSHKLKTFQHQLD